MAKERIVKNILIEELIENYPFSVNYLSKNGIRCIVCGEAIWGTLEEAAHDKGFDNETIEKFVEELNKLNNDFEEHVKEEIKNIDIDKLDV